MSEPILIARRAPKEHANGAPGNWWAEYRVRELAPDERWHRLQGYATHILEMRYCHEQDSEYCPGGDSHDGRWYPWNRGQSGQDAALQSIGDTAYQEAESLHPWHEAVKAEMAENKRRGERAAEIMRETHEPAWTDRLGNYHDAVPMTDDDVVKDEQEWAQGAWEREAKAARIWSKVLRNEADPAIVAAIKDRVRKAYEERLAARLERHHELLAELEGLEAKR